MKIQEFDDQILSYFRNSELPLLNKIATTISSENTEEFEFEQQLKNILKTNVQCFIDKIIENDTRYIKNIDVLRVLSFDNKRKYVLQLIDHPNDKVRSFVAEIFHWTFVKKLLHDPCEEVRYNAISAYMPKEMFVQMIKDPSYSIRSIVARNIDIKYLHFMKDDPSMNVVSSIISRFDELDENQTLYCIDSVNSEIRLEALIRSDKEFTKHLINDKSEAVKIAALAIHKPKILNLL